MSRACLRGRTWPVLAALFLPVLVGCGTNTALPYGPPRPRDASVDASRDAGVDASVLRCIDVPVDGGPVQAALSTDAEIGRADVVFLIDVTSSMLEEISTIRRRLRDVIAPAIRSAIPDSEVAVATFADFPVRDYGTPPDDYPFRLNLPVTADITQVQAAVDAITIRSGADAPEAQVEALYQLATGAGLGSYITPSPGCPSGGVGYACLRRDALPVVLLFTDAPFHNDAFGNHPYNVYTLGTAPHTAPETVAALNAIGARVIGFDSGDGDPRQDLEYFATRTDAIDASGQPLVYSIGTRGERLGSQVVTAIRTFATTVVQDIDAVGRDPDPTDGVDPVTFVQAITPLSADPPDGVGGITSTSFVEVVTGTKLTFQITIRPGSVVPGPMARLVPLEIVFRGNQRNRLGSEVVYLLIPGADGKTCADFGGVPP
ncbi:MAG: hypothetical protein U0230_03510 [Polyangiales bacterium]